MGREEEDRGDLLHSKHYSTAVPECFERLQVGEKVSVEAQVMQSSARGPQQ